MTGKPALLIVLLTACLAPPGQAHQLRAAITTVLLNGRTGNVEVMHRFFTHDAEHALSLLTGRGADLLDSHADRMRFAVYVHERFELEAVGAALDPLTLIGAELEGDFLWVYQRTPAPPGVSGLVARLDVLRDLWPDQVNTLNVEHNGTVRSLVFAGETGALRVDL